MDTSQPQISVGDWVRYRHGGELVIGIVEYIQDSRGLVHYIVSTGTLCRKDIWEFRSPN